ncbi:hypothetical protein SAMN06309944_1132 [Micrococcales bacterium KH10]|nr:hypothetical protein SAMN06309944_1132 [Micrococcales bacterium KH10]
MSVHHHRRSASWGVTAAVVTCAVVLVAGCSSPTGTAAPTAGSTAPAEPDASAASESQPADSDGRTMVSGEVVALTGGIAQVQDDSSQTAVTWDTDTSFLVTTAADFADIAVGSCVVVRGATPDGDEASTEDSSGTSSTELTATSIAISQSDDDGCTASGAMGFGGGMPGFAGGADRAGDAGGTGGTPPSGGEPPEGFEPPDGADASEGDPRGEGGNPPEGSGRPGGFGQFAVGEVTGIDDETITVVSVMPAMPPAGDETDDSSTADASDGQETTQIVTVTADTTYTATVAGDETAVTTGSCVVASGQADSAGTVTAASLTVSTKQEDGCTAGFPGGRRA